MSETISYAEDVLRTMLHFGISIGRKQAEEEQIFTAELVQKRLDQRKKPPLPQCPHHSLPLLRLQQPSDRGCWMYCPACRTEQYRAAFAAQRLSQPRQPRRIHLIGISDEIATVMLPITKPHRFGNQVPQTPRLAIPALA